MHDHSIYHQIDFWYKVAISFIKYFVKIIIAMRGKLQKGEVINKILSSILYFKILQKRFQRNYVLHISINITSKNII